MSTDIALMMYTIREACEEDIDHALATTRDVGFEWIEVCGLGDADPSETVKRLERHGLRACSGHHDLDELATNEPYVVDLAQALGYDTIVVPWTAARTRAEFDPVFDSLRRASDSLRSQDLSLAWHNHEFEFDQVDDEGTIWEALTREPNLLFELDLGWAWFARQNVQELLVQHAHRTPLVHIKDFASRNTPREFTPVGDGAVPWDEILAGGSLASVRFAIAEQDQLNGMPFRDAIERSFRAMNHLIG